MTPSRSSGSNSGAWRPEGNSIIGLPDAAFVLLRDLIAERTGVVFDDAKRGLLVDKLSELVVSNGLTSFLDYYYLLRYDADAATHWLALMDRLAVPETFFWRQADQIEAFANVIAPAHVAAYPGRPLRVWSAGCCTGEEPLSLAMALAENGMLDKHPVEIRATDGSPAMISRAKAGSYGPRSFRQLPDALRDKYFVQEAADRWRPVDRLRRIIRWDVANLANDDDIKRFASVDVIFCRNVFIYFSDDAIRRAVRVFAEYLGPDGALFLGASESLTRLGVEMELAEIGDAFGYVRLGGRQTMGRPTADRPENARDSVFTHQGNA